jgi:hypothetical protein
MVANVDHEVLASASQESESNQSNFVDIQPITD